jgi:SAM-dependent methyltransferase
MGLGLNRAVGKLLTISTRRMSCGEHITRYAMYERLKEAVVESNGADGKSILSISHSDVIIKHLNLGRASITEANYPEHTAVDLSGFRSDSFDYVLSDQVLEHVEGDPQRVFDETWRVLKPGGIAIHTTCFLNPRHGYPSDYWRFTVDGLRFLARNFSQIIQAEGFGNRAVWMVDFLGCRYTPVPHATWHPLHKMATTNNPNWHVSTWIVARK